MIPQKLGDQIVLMSPLLSTYTEIVHGFSTRIGGTSRGPYQSLNLSFAIGDAEESVRENRRRWYAALNVDESTVHIPKQVLESDILIGPPFPETPADGVLTQAPGRTLMTQSADCVLILLYDPANRAIGNLHASWRGALGEIARKGVEMMMKHFGTRPGDLAAALCPSIGPCCYEVREDVLGLFRQRQPHSEPFITRREGKYFLDLWGLNLRQLVEAGLQTARIDVAALCTRCHPEWFFSYRRDGGRTGRCSAAIGLR